MIRMEIALFLVMGMVAFIYFTSEKKITKLHRMFSVLLVTVLIYLTFDGITLMTLAFYLTLENPDIIRAELTEQKMSMLYLKSQVNPHFLYNTLDTIRIQAELNQDKKWLIFSCIYQIFSA